MADLETRCEQEGCGNLLRRYTEVRAVLVDCTPASAREEYVGEGRYCIPCPSCGARNVMSEDFPFRPGRVVKVEAAHAVADEVKGKRKDQRWARPGSRMAPPAAAP